MMYDPFTVLFAFFISILAICSMLAVIGIKGKLDEQTTVLLNILKAINAPNTPLESASTSEAQQLKKSEITKEGDHYLFDGNSYANLGDATAKVEERLKEKYGIAQEGDRYWFRGYSYAKLTDAIAYAELLESRNKAY